MSYAVLNRSRASRFVLSAVPATILTVGLFIGMKMMLDDGVLPPAQSEPQRVTKIAIPEKQTELKIRRKKPVRSEAAVTPPPMAKLSIMKSDIVLEPVDLKGAAPTEVNPTRLAVFRPEPIAMDRPAEPLRPPVPDYPIRALDRGIEGACDVHFDLTPKGKPFNVKANCTDRVFVSAAERAVKRSEFMPSIKDGTPVERRNVVYPLQFKIES
ncbi:MAG: TonB family protein [Pseudomonadota bacterium]